MPKLLRDVPSFRICLLQKRTINIKVSKLGQRSLGAKIRKYSYSQYKDGKMSNFRCSVSQKEHEGSPVMFICLITYLFA